jgi:hypothetical protein
VGLTVTALIAAAMHFALNLYEDTESQLGRMYGIAARLIIRALIVIFIWTTAYASTFFLSVVQDTASGTQNVVWSKHALWEAFLAFLYMAWLFVCSTVPFAMLVAPLRPAFGHGVFAWSLLPSIVLVFPFVLLSSLASQSLFGFHGAVIVALLLRPYVLVVLWTMSTLLLGFSVALGYLTIGRYSDFVFLAPVTGFTWSACLLIYARLLGRVAWIITGEADRAMYRARRRRKRQAAQGE